MRLKVCLAMFAGVALLCFPLLSSAQTLNVTNGIQTFTGLTNTTVTMSGRGELIITGTNNPLPGCAVHLNSPDAWLFLPNVRPSMVSTTLLSQVQANGAAAVAGSNCRLDQYAMGSVVVPQAPNFAALQVFTGPNFLGASTQLGSYTYYTNAALLGANYRNIGSFKLKHGYSATFAQNANGTGASRVFIAQDGDMDVSIMPTNLDRTVGFVRVFPWRWTGKKGWADTAGENKTIAPLWFYDWGSGGSSSLDAEYAPMKWSGGGSYSSFSTKQKSTQVLGFNEPDSTTQANMTVAAAIAEWPNLMQSGLRVGAPAVSDSATAGTGLDWLYSFMSQADSLGYRVDFVPIHFYKCNWTVTQFSNYLAGVYIQTGRPVWVTEFNNGANWCTTTPPTLDQNATIISQFVNMLESSPFVERYSIYNWVGTNRAMINTDGTLTPAGAIYRDEKSGLAYAQTPPPGGSRSIAQFLFENDTLDSSGYGNNGLVTGVPVFVPGHREGSTALSMDGANDFVQLPTNVANSASFTFAGWVYWNGGASWQRIFDFGNDTTHYMFLTASSGNGTLRFGIRNGGSEQIVETAPVPPGQWEHVALTLSSATAKLYTNGVLAASGSITITPSNFYPSKNYFGKSQFPADPLLNGSMDDVLITDSALTAAQIASLLTNQPPQFASNSIDGGSGSIGQAYNNSIAGAATDPDPGDALTYSKASGPAWLNVNANGSITGTPGPNDGGTNYFTVRATDSAGASAYAMFAVGLPVINANGTWSANVDGLWSDTNRWSGGTIANGAGFTADFSTLNITSDRTVTFDSSRTIGTLKFGDLSGTQNWIVASGVGNILTLDSGSSAAPSIVVNQNTATLATPLAGVSGFAKSGVGILVLAGPSSISGSITIDTGSTAVNEGSVRAAFPTALSGITNILIRDNNGGSSTLQLDGTAGTVVMPAHLAVNCRNTTVATIQNLAGTNVITGFIDLDVGGSLFNVESDSGLLVLHGTNRYVGSLTGGRSFVFSGAGDHLVSGPILNSTNGAPIGLIKSGAGTLTLAAANTYTNTTAVNGGTLLVTGSLGTSPITVASTAMLGGNGTIRGPVTIQAGGTLAPGNPGGALTINNSIALAGTTAMELNKTAGTSDLVRGMTSVTYGGALILTNLSGTLTATDSFQLFSAASYSGAFASITPPTPGPGLGWNTNTLATDGTLRVSVTVSQSPINVTPTITSSSKMELSWPADHTGWRLESNSVNMADTNFWFAVPGSDSTNYMVLPIDPGQTNVYFRLVFP